MAIKFEYKKRSADDVNKRSQQQASGSQTDKIVKEGFKVVTAKEGENRFRIMPPTWANPKHYGFDVWIHYGVGPDKGQYLCLDKMKGTKCPICEQGYLPAKKEWEDETNKARKEELKKYMNSLAPKRQVAMWVIDRNEEKEGPQLFKMPWTMDRNFSRLSIDPTDKSVISIDSPSEGEGYDIIFTRLGKGLNTEYEGEQIARRSTSLGDDKWLEFIMKNPIPDCFISFTYEYINDKYHAKLPNKVDGEEVADETNATSTHTTASVETAVEETDDAPETSGSAEETSESNQSVSFTYEELASLSSDDLVNFAKENAILNAIEIKMALASNSVLNKLCAKLNVTVPAPKASEPQASARQSLKDKLNKVVTEAKA